MELLIRKKRTNEMMLSLSFFLFFLCSDQVMGGVSMARLTREVFDGRVANVLRGHVKMDNNGGFIQMATNLKRDGTAVDVSSYDGLELLVQSGSDQTESFNVQYVDIVVVCRHRVWRSAFSLNPLAFLFLSYSLFFFVCLVCRTASRRPIVHGPFRRTDTPLTRNPICGNPFGCPLTSFLVAARGPKIHRSTCPPSNDWALSPLADRFKWNWPLPVCDCTSGKNSSHHRRRAKRQRRRHFSHSNDT
jgi:hypothetical protein